MTATDSNVESIPMDDLMLALDTMFEQRRDRYVRPFSMAIALLDGENMLIDTEAPNMLTKAWREEVDLQLVTNHQTLQDWLLGRFDPGHPDDEHVFLWSGDDSCLEDLRQGFVETQSLLGARMTNMTSKVGER